MLSRWRNSLWELDAQPAPSFILADGSRAREEAGALLERDVAPGDVIVPGAIPLLNVLCPPIPRYARSTRYLPALKGGSG